MKHSKNNSAAKVDYSAFDILRMHLIAITFLLGAVVMAGWIFDRPHWRSMLTNGAEVKANTAACLMLMGFAMALREGKAPGKSTLKVSNLAAILAGMVGLLTLIEFFGRWDFGIGELLFKDVPSPLSSSVPGMMSPLTALDLLFSAVAIVLLERETRGGSHPSQWLALIAAFLPAHILMCYVYGNTEVLTFGPGWSYMAAPTALALVSLALAILLHTPGRGIMRTLMARTQASRVFRRLVLAALLVPPALGWFVLGVLEGRDNPPEYGVSTTVILCVVVLMALGWLNATRLNRAEEALRESEERYRATFDHAAIGIAHVGVDGSWLRFNDAICDITGYPRHELQTMTFTDITHPDDIEPDWAQARRVLAGEIDTYSMEKRYIRKNGNVVWINLTVSLIRDPDGKPLNFISIVEDISERKHAGKTSERTAPQPVG